MEPEEHILAVGDIHGRLDILENLLDNVWPQQAPEARLVFLGDYIDRGPSSKQVVERLMALKAQRPETVLLRGNHEDLLLSALKGQRHRVWQNNGGQAFLQSYGLTLKTLHTLPADHLDFFNSLEFSHQVPDYIFVHGGLRPGVPLEVQTHRDMMWIREDFYMMDHDFGCKVVFGHSPFPRPLIKKHLIGIDTGAVYGNQLTCLLLPGERLISV